MDELKDTALVAGSDGMVGRHLLAELRRRAVKVVPVGNLGAHPAALRRLADAVGRTRPGLIFYAPAERYGIEAHRQAPGSLHYQSIVVFCQLMEAARRAGVRKVVNVLSHCVYPSAATVPYREADVWHGLPAPPLSPYGLARRMSLVHGAAYRAQYGLRTVSLILAGVYGPHDNFDPVSAQVVAGMIGRFVRAAAKGAPRVVCWGTGTPTREFLYVGDAVRGILEAARHYDADEPLNIGSQHEVAVRDLARVVARAADYRGTIAWDPSKPGGRPRVSLDTSRMRALLPPWKMVSLEDGVARTAQWFRTAARTGRRRTLSLSDLPAATGGA